MAPQIEGIVKHWRREFGFVLGEDGADYFLHSRECLKSGIAIPNLGDRIAFTPEWTAPRFDRTGSVAR
jgi:cold shock CspA family protein